MLNCVCSISSTYQVVIIIIVCQEILFQESFFGKVKIFSFWLKTMDYNKAF